MVAELFGFYSPFTSLCYKVLDQMMVGNLYYQGFGGKQSCPTAMYYPSSQSLEQDSNPGTTKYETGVPTT
jgi:hypothetical protein